MTQLNQLSVSHFSRPKKFSVSSKSLILRALCVAGLCGLSGCQEAEKPTPQQEPPVVNPTEPSSGDGSGNR